MAKGFAPHRIVMRDVANTIVRDEHFSSFAEADDLWSARCGMLPPDCTLTFQHGARVIKQWPAVQIPSEPGLNSG